MNVLVVSNMYPHPENPALGIFVKQQVESIQARGVGVDVLFVNGPKSKLHYALGVVRLARQLRERRYDLVHAHYHFSAYIARTQFGIPIVLTHHGAEVVTGWERSLCRLISPLVDRVIAVSPEIKAILGDQRIRVIPCGIDLDLFAPSNQIAARRALGLPLDRKLVLWAAGRRPVKRLDRAQEAVRQLQRSMPDVDLVVASGLRIDQVPAYMNACDALILTSDAEGSPQVVKEAMACNLPIVSVDVGDVAAVIGGTDGCHVARSDPADLALKLELALRRGDRTNGREAVQHLSLPAVADQVIQVYEETLRARAPARLLAS
jgi:glycosyltransferase involved in cell wall biosynthesis